MVGVTAPRLILRLDDGSVIGSDLLGSGTGPSRLPVDKAATVQRASEKEAARLSGLLATARQLSNSNAARHPLSSGGASKRPRMDSGHLTDAVMVGDWETKCRSMVASMGRALGTFKSAFWDPVNPQLLPDYYKIIQNPIFFGQIESRINKRKYASAAEFHADVKLAFNNCMLYNPVNDPYRKCGEGAEAEFDRLWVASGLADPETMEARGKRMTAGVARPKYEPPSLPSPSQGGTRGKGAGRSSSHHEATSRGRGAGPVSMARKQEMGELLESGELTAEQMEELTKLLPAEMLESENEELELDFELFDDDTTRRIDQFLRTVFGPPKSGDVDGTEALDDDDDDMSEDLAELDDSEDDE